MPVQNYQGPPNTSDIFPHLVGETIRGAIFTAKSEPVLIFESGEGVICKAEGLSRLTKSAVASIVDDRKKAIAANSAELERLGALLPGERPRGK